MATIQATKMRKGTLVKIGNDLFRVLELQHVTPGNLRGFVRVKFRNIRSGSLSDQKLRSEDLVEHARLDERQMQYMYKDGNSYHFMDTDNYEQLHISSEALGDSVNCARRPRRMFARVERFQRWTRSRIVRRCGGRGARPPNWCGSSSCWKNWIGSFTR